MIWKKKIGKICCFGRKLTHFWRFMASVWVNIWLSAIRLQSRSILRGIFLHLWTKRESKFIFGAIKSSSRILMDLFIALKSRLKCKKAAHVEISHVSFFFLFFYSILRSVDLSTTTDSKQFQELLLERTKAFAAQTEALKSSNTDGKFSFSVYLFCLISLPFCISSNCFYLF